MTTLNVCLLIPALREQKVIAQTMEHFSTLHTAGHQVRIVIVTTERENHEMVGNEKETTAAIVDRTIDRLNHPNKAIRFHRVHYPDTEGKRAHQINYGLDYVQSLFEDSEDIIMGFYDADSRPDVRTILHLIEVKRTHPRVNCFQQLSLFFSNYEKIKKSFWLTGAACNQTYFTLSNELTRLKKQSMGTHPPVCGHGFFIPLTLLKDMGGWPVDVWCEDMVFSLKLVEKGEKVGYLPGFDHCETPSTIPMYIRQSSAWFTTATEFRRHMKNSKIRETVLYHRDWLNIKWSMLPLFWFMILIIGFYNHVLLGIFLVLIWLGIQTKQVVLVNRHVSKVYSEVKYSHLWISTLCFFWVSAIGPLLAVYYKVNFFLTGRTVSHPKTER
jgi:cellulose synthase/poly-beta-1,6-N-acetylglucosamine synthase-like glycosyltransferase